MDGLVYRIAETCFVTIEQDNLPGRKGLLDRDVYRLRILDRDLEIAVRVFGEVSYKHLLDCWRTGSKRSSDEGREQDNADNETFFPIQINHLPLQLATFSSLLAAAPSIVRAL